MNLIGFIIILVIFLFSFVILFGAPYLPTLNNQKQQAFKLLKLTPGQTLLELGCGDGRVVKYAASQGITCIGYELNPLLVLVAKINTYKYRKNTEIIWGDYWKKVWPKTDGIFVFLLDKYMEKLDKKIVQQKYKNVKLVSFAFKIPNKKPVNESDGLFLYQY